MAGLSGQTREPRGTARSRRNSQNLASSVQFISSSSVVYLDEDGNLQLRLISDGGLQNVSGSLGILLDTNPGLVLSATGLKVDAASAQTDSGEDTITLSSVTTTLTDPADTPADADALRDDLVATTIPEIETALAALETRDGELETSIETLAGEFNSLLAKLRSANLLET